MKYCRECAAELEDTAKFCNKCGAKQPEIVVETKRKPVKKKATKQKSKVTLKKPEKKSNFQEKKMAIYEMTSQDNCGECGCQNCMSFAMQAASPKSAMDLDDCPYIDDDAAEDFHNTFSD